METVRNVVDQQLESLNDTDALASAWVETLDKWRSELGKLHWGGRGKGGRGYARQTFQPKDVIVPSLSLEYAGSDEVGSGSRTLLSEQTYGKSTLRLLQGQVYALVGRNGVGKSTLMKRIHAGNIPGFPPHINTMLIPQEVLGDDHRTPLQVLTQDMSKSLTDKVNELENQLEKLNVEDEGEQIELLCEQIAEIEAEVSSSHQKKRAKDALIYFNLDESFHDVPLSEMSGGLRKKVYLASGLFSLESTSLLMMDEPTNMLDIRGIFQLRALIAMAQEKEKIVLIVSHDVDLVNDCCSHVIHFANSNLEYYEGGYYEFLVIKRQREEHRLKEHNALAKQRNALVDTIENLKKNKAGKHGRKKTGAIASRKKKLERHGLMKNKNGHRWTVQNAGTGIREGAINSMDASSRKRLNYAQLLKLPETQILLVPDKAVQFKFRNSCCSWDEPLLSCQQIGHTYRENNSQTGADFLFQNVDLCVEENSKAIILGENSSGKTTLLKILAGIIKPSVGEVHRASGLNIAYYSQHVADDIISANSDNITTGLTAISLMMRLFPSRNEESIRADLASFGLGPKQATTNIKFLSGGERCRVCLTILTLGDQQSCDVLLLDEPTNHLDIESVEALAYGLNHWNGAFVMVSHDANLIRKLGGNTYILMKERKRLLRVDSGIDGYLKSFANKI